MNTLPLVPIIVRVSYHQSFQPWLHPGPKCDHVTLGMAWLGVVLGSDPDIRPVGAVLYTKRSCLLLTPSASCASMVLIITLCPLLTTEQLNTTETHT